MEAVRALLDYAELAPGWISSEVQLVVQVGIDVYVRRVSCLPFFYNSNGIPSCSQCEGSQGTLRS
jgi:hypothetical protein